MGTHADFSHLLIEKIQPESAWFSKNSGGLALEAEYSGGLGQNYYKENLKVRLSPPDFPKNGWSQADLQADVFYSAN